MQRHNAMFNKRLFKFNWTLSLWDRFRLWCKPTHMSIDFGYSRVDATAIVYFKVLDGRIYILDIKHER